MFGSKYCKKLKGYINTATVNIWFNIPQYKVLQLRHAHLNLPKFWILASA